MQRTVLLSQFCPSVCLSVRCVYCDKNKWCSAHILIPHERTITLVFWHQHWLVGDAPFPVKYSPKVTRRLWKTPISQHKHVLFRPSLAYNNCRQLHNELFGCRHSTPQPHGLSAIAELLVTPLPKYAVVTEARRREQLAYCILYFVILLYSVYDLYNK